MLIHNQIYLIYCHSTIKYIRLFINIFAVSILKQCKISVCNLDFGDHCALYVQYQGTGKLLFFFLYLISGAQTCFFAFSTLMAHFLHFAWTFGNTDNEKLANMQTTYLVRMYQICCHTNVCYNIQIKQITIALCAVRMRRCFRRL